MRPDNLLKVDHVMLESQGQTIICQQQQHSDVSLNARGVQAFQLGWFTTRL